MGFVTKALQRPRSIINAEYIAFVWGLKTVDIRAWPWSPTWLVCRIDT